MKNTGKIAWICGAAAVIIGTAILLMLSSADRKDVKTQLVIGTYGEHLYRYSFDSQTLEFELEGKAQTRNPSYALASVANGIFVANEAGKHSGASSFQEKGNRIAPTAGPLQTGADPCFLMLFDEGRYLLTADYSGGSISVFPVSEGQLQERADLLEFEGSGPVKGRQESSHIHQIRQVPQIEDIEGEWLLASDLGADAIRMIYVSRISSMKHGESIMPVHISDIPCPAGSGPRHMEFSKDGRILYCIAELSGEVLVYDITSADGAPAFTLRQRILADEVNAGGSADIHIHPSGKWLYTSHRLDNDGISTFSITEDGTLEKIGYTRTARHPRNFMITEDGRHLIAACRDDRIIQVFSIGPDGLLTLTPSVLQFESDMPSSVTAAAD